MYCIYMIILQEISSTQILKFIPRLWVSGGSYKIIVKNESTNKEVYNETVTTIASNLYYYTYSAAFTTIKQNIFYTLEILSGTSVIFKDKIFCTNQTISDYSINSGEYIANTTTNEYIYI